MIKKIKNYFRRLKNDINSLYIPLKKVLLVYLIIIILMFACGYFIGIVSKSENTSKNNITLARQENVELGNNNYYLLPTLPYVEDGNVYYSNDCLIFYSPIDVTPYSDYGLIYSQRSFDNTVLVTSIFENDTRTSNQSICINYGDYSYARKYKNVSFTVLISVKDINFADKVDNLLTYNYLIDTGDFEDGTDNEIIRYNTVYELRDSSNNVLVSIFFIPETNYINHSENLITTISRFSSKVVFSLDVTKLFDIGFDSGATYWLEQGYSIGFNEGQDRGYKDGFKDGEESHLTFWNVITNGINTFLNINILPNISIGTICLIPIALLMFNLLIKLFKV